MTKEFDLLVFIGRFQPFHIEHHRVVQEALDRSKYVIVLVGSAGQPPSPRNPWSFHERAEMIKDCFPEEIDNERLQIAALHDHTYNDTAWVNSVRQAVAGMSSVLNIIHEDDIKKIGLIGASKDSSSYYLNLFPEWDSVDVGYKKFIHATEIRKMFFEEEYDEFELATNILPRAVCKHLYEFKESGSFDKIREEFLFIRDYKKAWESAPYPPTFLTVDAVVEQSGHIIVIERKFAPGKGLLALPGGFKGQDETLLNACIRELIEETRIKVPENVLRGSIVSQQVFDDPHRSARGCTVTQAFHIKLKDGKLPKLRGGDDAKTATWYPISDLRSVDMFEDHYHIIKKMLGLS